MSGESYASFTFAGQGVSRKIDGVVLDVSWQWGTLGLAAATRFEQEDWAARAASRVLGVDGPPRVVPLSS